MATWATGYRPEQIRNLVLLGHAGSGKTTLAEAMLHRCGAVTRMGAVEQALSTESTLLFATKDGCELNVIDTPGSSELVGHALAALPAVEMALVVVSAAAGVELSTRRLYHAAREAGLACLIVVNKIDLAPANLPPLVRELRESLGRELHCINLPCRRGTDVIDCFDEDAGDADFGSVAEEHQAMLESAVEIDDAALERYLAGEAIDLPTLRKDLIEAMNRGHVVPIVFTAAKSEVGVDDLLHILVNEAPSPVTGRPRRLMRGDEVVEVACDCEAPLLGHVFKVATDPYLGKLAMIRLLQGKLDSKTPFVYGAEKRPHDAGHVLKIEGRDHPAMDSVAYAGDLVAVARIENLHVDAIVHPPGTPDTYTPLRPRYPHAMCSLAIEPKNKADEVKMLAAVQRLCEEDPTLTCVHDGETHELVLSGLGELHLRVALEKLEQRFRVAAIAHRPRVAFRETITQRAEGHHRLKKQTGGAGQFAEVFLRIEPLPRGSGFEFASEVFGGSIPTQYLPACEKGVHDAIATGPLGGYPVEDLRVVVHDGKSHAVDSKDIAFRSAAKLAFRDAFGRARPMLLEPIVTLEVTTPEGHVGDVTADLKTRRGRVVGVDTLFSGTAAIHAQVPLAELRDYAGALRGLTSGAGSFVTEPSHYDFVPPAVQRRVTAEHAAPGDE
ncbi:MAG TPA: elongation factor G [Kofleriaceae bacterium]|nr:elongation factor G [Kofleriaceae bacterium]